MACGGDASCFELPGTRKMNRHCHYLLMFDNFFTNGLSENCYRLLQMACNGTTWILNYHLAKISQTQSFALHFDWIHCKCLWTDDIINFYKWPVMETTTLVLSPGHCDEELGLTLLTNEMNFNFKHHWSSVLS
jgi:hypothetical protein